PIVAAHLVTEIILLQRHLRRSYQLAWEVARTFEQSFGAKLSYRLGHAFHRSPLIRLLFVAPAVNVALPPQQDVEEQVVGVNDWPNGNINLVRVAVMAAVRKV